VVFALLNHARQLCPCREAEYQITPSGTITRFFNNSLPDCQGMYIHATDLPTKYYSATSRPRSRRLRGHTRVGMISMLDSAYIVSYNTRSDVLVGTWLAFIIW
jgi:hypothetical protein